MMVTISQNMKILFYEILIEFAVKLKQTKVLFPAVLFQKLRKISEQEE